MGCTGCHEFFFPSIKLEKSHQSRDKASASVIPTSRGFNPGTSLAISVTSHLLNHLLSFQNAPSSVIFDKDVTK